jgi:hypothetical protein
MNRITKDKITKLVPGEIFVFGSNLAGIHGAGAAKTALKWGALHGVHEGLCGRTYAIPTKDINIETLPIENIKSFVLKFEDTAWELPDLTFLVTEIGCGLAGYTPEDIAPLFKDCMGLSNVYLPKRFWDVLNKM